MPAAPLKKDKAFRRYESNVERALALFDTPQQEWADYISFLGRLLKAIQTHPQDVPHVPHSATIAIRLAQCLNPSLPSGVHQKALEVYAYIFSILTKPALSQNLHVYFPGLASVLSFASLSVRPAFLSLIETYVLAVDAQALRPALKSIILCLLPGLEDETAEDFERILQIVDKLRFTISGDEARKNDGAGDAQDSYFWQCFFLATITNVPRRQGALAYLVRRLPQFGTKQRRNSVVATEEDDVPAEALSMAAEAAIAPEPGLLIRCFAAGLGDSQLLVQRGYLDLLVNSLPLHSEVLQVRIDGKDLERLVSAAAGVVTRRDMSLNRRLWSWFLGPDPGTDADGGDGQAEPKSPVVDVNSHHAAYFARYGLQPLTNGIMSMINTRDQSPAAHAKPFRVCLSLMDRWEVGGLLVPSVFLPLLESARRYGESTSRENFEEVLRSASIFFDGVESGLIWGKLFELLDEAMPEGAKDREKVLQKLKLAKFIITRFNIREEEMLLHHVPLVACATLKMLNHTPPSVNSQNDTENSILTTKLDIVDILVQSISDRALANKGSEDGVDVKGVPTTELVRAFYNEQQGNLETSGAPCSFVQLRDSLLQETVTFFINSLRASTSDMMKEISTKLLSNILSRVSDTTVVSSKDLLAAFEEAIKVEKSQGAEHRIPFSSIIAVTTIMTAFQPSNDSPAFFPPARMPDLVNSLVVSTWYYLSPFRPKYHVEAVRCLWQLQAMTASDHLVEAAVTSLMTQATTTTAKSGSADAADAGRRLAVLWTHTIHEQNQQAQKPGRLSRRTSGLPVLSGLNGLVGGYQSVLTRPLFLLLDSLAEEGTELFFYVRTWLQDLPSLNRVFDIIMSHLQSLHCIKYQSSDRLDAPVTRPPVLIDDSRECLYHMQQLLNIFRWSSDHTWVVLSKDYVPVVDPSANEEQELMLQNLLVRICMRALSVSSSTQSTGSEPHIDALYRTTISTIRAILLNPYSLPLKDLELESFLMARLQSASPSLQSLLLEATLAALQLRLRAVVPVSPVEHRISRERTGSIRESVDKAVEEEIPVIAPPPQLVECLRNGFSSPSSRLVLDDWVKFLIEVLPLFADTIFQNLLPLVECLCKQIQLTFGQLKSTFSQSVHPGSISPESTLIALMNGLEQILANAHQRLVLQEMKVTTVKTPEQPQGFFGNMVSGVFANEANQTRAVTANSRLTVLLCFQDTVRICFGIWSWGGYGHSKHDHTSLASFGYTSLRMRNRARRILEHLFTAETLECLETLAVVWCRSPRASQEANAVMSLLNVLNGSSPKHTTPAIFNAVYSRTNPHALDPHRMSTLTSDLADTDLVAFLVDYTKSLEDDAMDEIWPDCLTFLRDVLANPMPHRQILPALLEFTATLAEKVDNTNFGEQRRMRRDLGDLFMRLLTATFTTRPMGYFQDSSTMSVDKIPEENGSSATRSSDIVTVLVSILPKLPLILVDNDRIANAATSISTNVIGPAFRAKAFPETVSPLLLDLIYELTRTSSLPAATKAWKRDIEAAFNDTKFFATETKLALEKWLPVLRMWSQNDKDRMPELLSRLSAPTTAGIMFGVGATSARLEADRKTQLNLRRMTILVLANPEDTYTINLGGILEKLTELLTATPASSPSSATRADIFLLLRALVLRISPVHLAPVWPVITAELTHAIASVLPDDKEQHERYNNLSVLQACKLLDTLVTLAHDDFQLHEWLFLTDTIDAVYRPDLDWRPVALVDEVAEALQERQANATAAAAAASAADEPAGTGAVADDTAAATAAATSGGPSSLTSPTTTTTTTTAAPAPGKPAASSHDQENENSSNSNDSTNNNTKRRSLLAPVLRAAQEQGVFGDSADAKAMGKMAFVLGVVRPFLGQLSILAFEETYRMGAVDLAEVEAWVAGDVFDEGGIA
ncbi:cellular morphogenesis regulator [Diplodia corticola]|uniref:Cellular morphogenesis regulator n=1 Tax=Diplodia corticola TaxID=236234 RepID=A0A1J9RBR9_9PEZI|nr:cellular morphogenesis regulator [Diplodia corticola]OJD37905.1 cellular morphogenesis regulator [Diplodia corticola]